MQFKSKMSNLPFISSENENKSDKKLLGQKSKTGKTFRNQEKWSINEKGSLVFSFLLLWILLVLFLIAKIESVFYIEKCREWKKYQNCLNCQC